MLERKLITSKIQGLMKASSLAGRGRIRNDVIGSLGITTGLNLQRNKSSGFDIL